MKLVIRIIGILLIVLLTALLGFIYWNSPQYDGEVALTGLSKEVVTHFDEYGVPHIYAQNEADAYRALGYVHAQERLFQLEMLRRVGSGTLAELLGPDVVEIDQFFHTLGIPKHAKESTKALLAKGNSPWKSALEAYIEGVNQFIEQGQLPVEYLLLGEKPRVYTLDDMHSVLGYMSFSFAMGLKTDPLVTQIARKWGSDYLASLSVQSLPSHHVIPVNYPDSLVAVGSIVNSKLTALLEKLPTPLLEGSNAWVISGSRTKSGKVLFANDTHIDFASPSIWFEAHIEYPGYSFYGNHLAGIPFGLVGHSRHHSVGLTMFENDDQDFFEEKLNPTNSNEILVGDSIYPITSRTEVIQVKGQPSIAFEIKETIHGPVINPVVKEIRALTSNPVTSWWVYLLEPTRALEAVYQLNHASTMQDVADASSLIHAPGLNIMYGDDKGNIAWWAAAKLPIRGAAVHSKIFADGSDLAAQPQGWYPFTENPQSINPESGFIASANNQPDSTRSGLFFPGYYYPGERWNRIAKTVTAKKDWDQESMQALQLETVNEQSIKTAAFLLTQVEQGNFEKYTEILEELGQWEGDHDLKHTAPTLFYKWLYHTLRLAMEDELGKEGFESYLQTFMMIRSTAHFLNHEQNLWWDKKNTKTKEKRAEIISEALRTSLDELTQQFGEDQSDWEWKKAISVEHPHPLGAKNPLDKLFNVRTEAVEANEESVNKLAFKLNGSGIYKVTSGPAMRILLDFENVEKSVSVLPTGNSGNRFSKHYSDQKDLFVEGKYRPQLMNKEEILEDAKGTLKLVPKK
ncbi:MAG: penicillin acylase family protein [Bacteroidetes bacterium]|nr:penicillin acylase family protein [Bacteroidota bacterium]